MFGLLLAFATAALGGACAGPVEGVESARIPTLRIGTSGDYAPFSAAEADRTGASGAANMAPPTGVDIAPTGFDIAPTGFDIAVAESFAADTGRSIEWVFFRWPDLLDRFRAGDFDLVMSGVTVRPERSVAGRFSLPVAMSGAVALVRADAAWRSPRELDRTGLVIAVNQGGHLERVTRREFPHAEIRAIPDNRIIPAALLAGDVDAVVTDTLEAPHWLRLRTAPALRAIGPFTRDTKAYWVPAESAALAAELDSWLAARERDGRLAAWRRDAFGPDLAAATAEPLPALLAAIDERLALMPYVAEAKRKNASPVEVPAVEERVIVASLAAVARAAREAKRPEPSAERIEALYRALIEAAKAVQREQLERPADPQRGIFDLSADLRPALLRIGEHIAAIVVRLQTEDLEDDVVRAATFEALGAHQLDDARLGAIALAIAGLTQS